MNKFISVSSGLYTKIDMFSIQYLHSLHTTMYAYVIWDADRKNEKEIKNEKHNKLHWYGYKVRVRAQGQ